MVSNVVFSESNIPRTICEDHGQEADLPRLWELLWCRPSSDFLPRFVTPRLCLVWHWKVHNGQFGVFTPLLACRTIVPVTFWQIKHDGMGHRVLKAPVLFTRILSTIKCEDERRVLFLFSTVRLWVENSVPRVFPDYWIESVCPPTNFPTEGVWSFKNSGIGKIVHTLENAQWFC